MAPFMSSCVTVHSTPEIISTARNRHFAETNSVLRLVVRLGKIEHFSSQTSRVCDSRWVSLMLTQCRRQQLAAEFSQQAEWLSIPRRLGTWHSSHCPIANCWTPVTREYLHSRD